jgi:hypothetical protein
MGVVTKVVALVATNRRENGWDEDESVAFGAEGRNRTDDLLITNQLLYQLSYFSLKRTGKTRESGPEDDN